MDTLLLWFKGLVAAFITGAATALTTTQGCDLIGAPLNWHQVGAVGLAAGFYGACAYLKQAPVPPTPVLEIPFRPDLPRNTVPQPPSPPKPMNDKIDQ